MVIRIGIIGAGKLGRALANALHTGQFTLVGVHDQNLVAGHDFAQRQGLRFFSEPLELINLSTVVFLSVPDNVISPLARIIAAHKPRGQTFFHCSGASGPELISPLAATAQIGCLHPLQTFVSEQTPFQDVWCALDGNAQVLAIGEQIARALGAHAFILPASDKALYHVAACIVSNYLVTLSAVAEDLFATWQVPKEAFMPLVSGSVRNLMAADHCLQALTGPIVRGDSRTIAKHLAALPPAYQELYRTLGLTTCRLLQQGQGAPDNCEHLEKILLAQEAQHE